MDPVKVVAHYIDDMLEKGFTYDFNPTHQSFLLHKDDGGSPSGQPLQLELKEIKAVFFVKTFEGDKDYHERKEFIEGDRVLGRRIEVTFIDGEVIRGYTVDYDPQRQGFFLIPIDTQSNNIQIFVD
jgi:hypothetical protein